MRRRESYRASRPKLQVPIGDVGGVAGGVHLCYAELFVAGNAVSGGSLWRCCFSFG